MVQMTKNKINKVNEEDWHVNDVCSSLKVLDKIPFKIKLLGIISYINKITFAMCMYIS